MSASKTSAILFIFSLLSSAPLYATEIQAEHTPVQMISGGIGDAEMKNITAVQKQYSLKLIFTEADGEYLADIGVLIRDTKGNTVVDTTSGGPILLMKLTPGSYTLSSSVTGETKTQHIKVHGTGLNTYYIHLHSTES